MSKIHINGKDVTEKLLGERKVMSYDQHNNQDTKANIVTDIAENRAKERYFIISYENENGKGTVVVTINKFINFKKLQRIYGSNMVVTYILEINEQDYKDFIRGD